jgi:DNA-binding LacI/PurR family transcriptional regulator/DNA-binding transcriptional regulator YhcF (GntR family)
MSTPLYEQLYRHVIDAIRAGTLKLGDRVPSEKELADQFNVSRITSKKALEMLQQAGLIERIRGKGSFVASEIDVATSPAMIEATARDSNHSGGLGAPFVGVIVPDFADAYALKMIHAMEEACAAADMFIVVKRTYGSQQVEKEAIQKLVANGIRGLIVFPVHGEYYNPELLRLVLGGFPVVLVDRLLKGIPAASVITDNHSASAQLTRYLLQKGHRHIAFIAPPAENTSTIEARIEGYRAALQEARLDEAEYILTALYSTLPTAFEDSHIQQDAHTLRTFIAAHPELTAFVACEFNLALLLRDVLASLPLEREIVCFDSPDMPLIQPLFTHIKQDESQIGRQAIALLLEAIAGAPQAQAITVPFTFVERIQP